MTLYDIDAAIMGCIDEESGEVVDLDKLEALEMERDKKVSNIACWIKDLNAEAKALKEEKDNLAQRQKVCENKSESLKTYLTSYLNGAKFEDTRVKISYRKSTSAVYTGDVDTLPDEYCNIKRTASLTAIKEALTSGTEIEGATLVERNNIQIK